ncbi:MAG: PD40 domain-containing protein [Armatimonadetes bacterium]|nr:PD40 domain-containing protein [Anaerolineae bacterium]
MFSRFDARILIAAGGLALLVALTALLAMTQAPIRSGARIAYLSPTRGPYNLYLVDPAAPDTPEQVTQAPNGVLDYAVSADGRSIAYTEPRGTLGHAEIMLLDLQSKRIIQLTDCLTADAYCTTPAWRPDGTVLAYQRTEFNTALNLPPGAPRIWLLDLTSTPHNSFPLLQDSQMLGAEPQWSANGERLVFYESNSQSVLVYNFAALNDQDRLLSIPAGNGAVGVLSPDGTRLAFPEIVDGAPFHAVLRLADLTTGTITPLTEVEDIIDDNAAAWHPDGERVAVMRVYLDARYTRGYQIYLMDVATRTARPLIEDAAYQHSAIAWSADGSWLALSRYRVIDATAETTPEIWAYALASGALTRVAADGFAPRWVNGVGTAQ